jgi:hypothetical protein
MPIAVSLRSALGKKSSHIPYRNSKLTHVLSSSLGGNSKCLMVVNVSPSSLDVDESNCSLTFAARVRSVELGAASKNQTSNAGPSEGGAAAGAASSAAAGATPVKRPASAAVKASPDAKARPAVGAAAGAAKKPLAAAPGSATKKPAAK